MGSRSSRTRVIERLNRLYKEFEPSDWIWLVSYSGGKDSTLLLLHVLSFAEERGFKIHVVYNDSGGDLPELRNLAYTVISLVNRRGHTVHITRPERTFFDYLLTKYSPPRWNFRWCCKRLKEVPFRRLVYELSSSFKVLNLVGTRREEARWRNWYIKKVSERIVYVAPLHDFTSAEVWEELRLVASGEFAFVYERLRSIYNGADRSGCWFCPLVVRDRLLESRPHLLKLKLEILASWCSERRERILELSKLYPELVEVKVQPSDINSDYPCKRKCMNCQVNLVKQVIRAGLSSHTNTQAPTGT